MSSYRLPLISLLLFLTAFLLCSWYNRLASDDFEFASKLREFGFTGSILWFYDHWNTRWCALLLINIFLKLWEFTGTMLWIHLISISVLFYAYFNAIKNLCVKLEPGRNLLIILSGFSLISFFYTCFSISDVFFWLNTSTMYLWSVIAFLFGFAEIIRKGKIKIPVLVLSGIYTGGSNEPLALTVLIAACAIFVASPFFSNAVVKKTIVFSIFVFISFLISYLGEGHEIRSSFLPDTGFIQKVWITCKAIIKMFGIYLPGKILIVILFSFPWMLLGIKTKQLIIWKHTMGRMILIFFVLVFISLAPTAWIMSEMGPERAWTQVSFYFTALISCIAFYAGNITRAKAPTIKFINVLSVISIILILTTGVIAVIKAQQYSEGYEERMILLQKNKKQKSAETINLKPLPDSGWLHSAEISTDPWHFTNQHLKNYLELKFDIVKRQ